MLLEKAFNLIRSGQKLRQKLQKFYDSALFWAWDNPAKMSALITVPGDALTMVSGIAMQNWGRIVAGGFGVVSQIPVILFGDQEVARDAVIEDPQDSKTPWAKKIYQALRHPGKYPFEFYSYLNLMQTTLMTVLSGPAWHEMGIKEDTRPGEATLGFISTGAFAVMLLREDEEDYEPESPIVKKGILTKAWETAQLPIQDLKETFNFSASYAAQAYIFGMRDAFNNATHEISKRGPNQIAAKIMNYALVPYAIEAAVVNDKASLAAAGIYYFSNIFLRESSKRVYRAEPA